MALGSAVEPPFATLSDEEGRHEFSATAVLKGSGNAIVPELAAEFLMAYMDVCNERD